MRHILLACLILWHGAAGAFEIEAETVFSAPGATRSLNILSTTDTAVFAPIIAGFQAAWPGISVTYVEASSSEVFRGVIAAAGPFDIAISSAMDLQTKLANDGHVLQYRSDATARVPDWGRWRDAVFAFTQEPAAIVLSRAAFAGQDMPRTRLDLIEMLRARSDEFDGRIGTYDVRVSGLGYLFATQDSRTSETFWRLTELMGQLNVRLYCCSSDMIEDVASGRIAIAYNVLGSYASARTDLADRIVVIEPQDYTTVMLRSAVMLNTTRDRATAQRFLDHLLTAAWGGNRGGLPFPDPFEAETGERQNLRRIPLGPGLLVFLDRLKREQFLSEWNSAMFQ